MLLYFIKYYFLYVIQLISQGGENGHLTPYARKALQKRFIQYEGCRLRHIDSNKFEVRNDLSTESVQLERGICTYDKWQKCGILCEHAIQLNKSSKW